MMTPGRHRPLPKRFVRHDITVACLLATDGSGIDLPRKGWFQDRTFHKPALQIEIIG